MLPERADYVRWPEASGDMQLEVDWAEHNLDSTAELQVWLQRLQRQAESGNMSLLVAVVDTLNHAGFEFDVAVRMLFDHQDFDLIHSAIHMETMAASQTA